MRKIRFVALLLALALLLCACGAAKTPLEQAAGYLKKAAPEPGYGSLNGDWTVFFTRPLALLFIVLTVVVTYLYIAKIKKAASRVVE